MSVGLVGKLEDSVVVLIEELLCFVMSCFDGVICVGGNCVVYMLGCGGNNVD